MSQRNIGRARHKSTYRLSGVIQTLDDLAQRFIVQRESQRHIIGRGAFLLFAKMKQPRSCQRASARRNNDRQPFIPPLAAQRITQLSCRFKYRDLPAMRKGIMRSIVIVTAERFNSRELSSLLRKAMFVANNFRANPLVSRLKTLRQLFGRAFFSAVASAPIDQTILAAPLLSAKGY